MKKILSMLAVLALVSFIAVSCGSAPAAKADAGGKEAAAPVAKVPDTKGAITLKATKAKLTKGQGSEGLTIEAGGNVGYWSALGDIVAFDVDVEEAGTYTLVLTYSMAASFAGAKVDISIADQVLPWEVVSTSDWGNFKKIAIGDVELAAGSHELVFTPTFIKDRFVANLLTAFLVKVN